MKNRIGKMAVSLLLVTALLFAGCGSISGSGQNTTAQNGTPRGKQQFGTFVTTNMDGTEVNQDIFAEAQLTMVNIWATYCSPCISEMPHLQELSEEYADKNVAIVGIISDVTQAGDPNAVEVMELTGVRYPQLVHSQDLYDNFLHLVQAVPTTVFVDKEGIRVGDVIMGAKTKDGWIEEIEKRLEMISDEQE